MLTYKDYLRHIANRLNPILPYLCYTIERDKFWWLNPWAWRLKKEIKRCVAIGDRYGFADGTLDSYLRHTYGIKITCFAEGYAARILWLSDLEAQSK